MDSVVALAFNLDLDVSDLDPDSGYATSAFLNFAWVCDLAGSEDEPPGFVSVSVYI